MTDPQLYVQNGCKNWSLIHKHAAILEKENTTGNTTAINPAMADLQRHGIVFPKHKSPCSSSTTLYRCIPSNAEEEREQLNMMLKQSMLDQSQLTCYSVTAPPFLTRQSEPKLVITSP